MKYEIGKSDIHGKGIICKQPIEFGENIGLVVDEETKKITDYLGKWVNHSWNPNSRLIGAGANWYLQAIKGIKPGDEIVADYNDTPDFLSKANPNWD